METALPTLPAAEHEGPLVLIIDDDPAVRDSLAAVMEAFGFRIATAGNGFEGMAAIASLAPSTIITDIHMPDMDGFELLTTLKATRPNIPVVVISGGVAKGYDFVGKAKKLGAVAAFQKPLPVFEMIDTINALTS